MPETAAARKSVHLESAPFESASELREAHARLLEALDSQLGDDASAAGEAAALTRLEAEVRQLLERGAATGVFLEEVRERTACQTLLDYWVSSLAQAGMRVAGARLARFDGDQLPDLKDKPCPYVGLDAFQVRTFFFGREPDTEALLAQVRECPLVVVLGASGSGKSSLVKGGVLPALDDEQSPSLHLLTSFVPGSAVLDRLAAALEEGGEKAPVLVTIDQFEEVFTLCTAADREALAENLAKLLAPGLGHRVILTMREEFRSRMVELRALSPWLDKAWYSMRPLGYDELKAAVERPAAMVNLQFQEGIVDDLVKKVLGQPAALPLLQFTLRSLWRERDRNRITWEVYRRTGDPLNALKASADQFYDGLARQTQDEVRRVLLALVRVDDLLEAYRQPLPKSRLLQAGKANTKEVLALLAAHDYLRILAGADPIVEVKHESLVRNWPRFVSWIDDKRIERRQRLALTQAAQRWAESGKPAEGLLTGWQLEEAKNQQDLSGVEKEFVESSAEAVERMQREREEVLRREGQAKALAETKRALLNRTRAALIFVLLAATATAGAAYHYWQKSRDLDRQAQRQAQTATMLSRLQKDTRARLAKVQADYNELFAKQVQAVAPVSRMQSRQPVTIFLHISADEQRPRAQEIARLLRENGITVPGIQRVNPVRHSNVRYFREQDAQGAEEIARLLNEYLAAQALLKPELIRGYERKVPEKRYEIWFAPDALGGAAKPEASAAR